MNYCVFHLYNQIFFIKCTNYNREHCRQICVWIRQKLDKLTRATWTVNSTPIPTEAMRMTTGTALSLMPISPIMPNSSTVISDSTSTW